MEAIGTLIVATIYLDFGDDLFFRSVDITTIDDAQNVTICPLKGSYSRPQNSFTASTGITSGLDCIR
jgi:hypothetical protein